MNNILIIGLGNIGFYHYYSLSKNKRNIFNIFLCDNDISNIKKIKNLPYKKFFNNIEEIKSYKFDIVILSTNANERYAIFKSLVKNNIVKNIIFEKIAFNSLQEISKVKKELNFYKINSWINCNYQTIPFFKNLLGYTKKNKFEMKVFGGKWSIGTSAIHFIDLFSYLSNSNIKAISFKSYSGKIFKSKRSGYYEFDGIFTLEAKNGNSATIEKTTESNMPLFLLLKSKDLLLTYDDSKRIINIYDEKNNWSNKKQKIKVFLQSELSLMLVKDIISKGICDLPLAQNSLDRHKLMLSSIKREFKNSKLINKENVNIT